MKKLFYPILFCVAIACSNNENNNDNLSDYKELNLKDYGYNITLLLNDQQLETVNIEDHYFLNVDFKDNLGFSISEEEYNQQFELSNPGLQIYIIEKIEESDDNLVYKRVLKSGDYTDYAFYIKLKNGLVVRNREEQILNKSQLDEIRSIISRIKMN